jgi:hypothetical protein
MQRDTGISCQNCDPSTCNKWSRNCVGAIAKH